MWKSCSVAVGLLSLAAGPAFAQENPVIDLQSSFAELVEDGWQPLFSMGQGVVMMARDDDYALCHLPFNPNRPAFNAPCYQITE